MLELKNETVSQELWRQTFFLNPILINKLMKGLIRNPEKYCGRSKLGAHFCYFVQPNGAGGADPFFYRSEKTFANEIRATTVRSLQITFPPINSGKLVVSDGLYR